MRGNGRATGWVAVGLLGLTAVPAFGVDDWERAPIEYSKATPDNVVSRLQKKLDAGTLKLENSGPTGYLRSVLGALDVPISAQTLVFSRTSLQRHRIAPRTPRAIYFNERVYVGYCNLGDVLEISAADPKLGAVFYTLEQDSEKKPRFVRQTDSCMLCHASSNTQGVPGHVVRSVFVDPRGLPILSAGTYRVDQNTPFDRRWGGWYVTGTHGKQTHLGNLIIRTLNVPRPVENPEGLNLKSLGDRFDRSAYLSPHSDIVALMVLEHQAEAHNLLTRARFAAIQALHMEEMLNREMKLPATHRWDSTRVRIRSAGEALLRYMLFSEEAPLTDRVCGTSTFAADFARQGPRDDHGRSLRQFDLQTRLFRYRCSYLIYSDSFAALPQEMRNYVLERLWQILNGRDTGGDFAHLEADERTAIREIVAATVPDLPACWGTPRRAKKEARVGR